MQIWMPYPLWYKKHQRRTRKLIYDSYQYVLMYNFGFQGMIIHVVCWMCSNICHLQDEFGREREPLYTGVKWLMSKFQDPIPEVIPIQKYHTVTKVWRFEMYYAHVCSKHGCVHASQCTSITCASRQYIHEALWDVSYQK
jgi:hypothetical protein